MKSFLLHEDKDFDIEQELPSNATSLSQDLELDTLLRVMAGDDEFLLGVARSALFSSLAEPEAILYRQDVLGDCLRQPDIVTGIYSVAVEAIRAEKQVYRGMFSSPGYVLHRAIDVLQLYVGVLKQLRGIAEQHAAEFTSAGFTRFFAMLRTELDETYFRVIEDHLRQLRFRDGVLLSARLGLGNVGIDYVLREPDPARKGLISRLSGRGLPGHLLTIADRDEGGHRTLSDLGDRGINLVANALAQSTDHILGFLTMLRRELGFYVGCLNLHGQLTGSGEPACFPVPLAAGKPALSCHGLRDTALALRVGQRVIGNDASADGKALVLITGANQGGKSTFLRSVGLAQLMMQCGMFVCAESFSADVCAGVFTHYKREEDATMTSGKLDEELGRMSEIVNSMTPNCLLLCNESFAATNEREGSEIARHIVRALVDSGVKVFFVTHFFDLADAFYQEDPENALFLRAERQDDGRRTYRMVESGPLPTSYAQDVYERIFGESRTAGQGPVNQAGD
jgi:hypothetical protein